MENDGCVDMMGRADSLRVGDEGRSKPKYKPLRAHQSLPEALPSSESDNDPASESGSESGSDSEPVRRVANPFEMLEID